MRSIFLVTGSMASQRTLGFSWIIYIHAHYVFILNSYPPRTSHSHRFDTDMSLSEKRVPPTIIRWWWWWWSSSFCPISISCRPPHFQTHLGGAPWLVARTAKLTSWAATPTAPSQRCVPCLWIQTAEVRVSWTGSGWASVVATCLASSWKRALENAPRGFLVGNSVFFDKGHHRTDNNEKQRKP